MPDGAEGQAAGAKPVITEEVRAAVVAELEAKHLAGTTWKSIDAVVESAKNAASRINESTKAEKEAKERAAKIEADLQALRDQAGKKSADASGSGSKDDEIKDPVAYLETMEAEEQKTLDDLMKADPVLRKATLSGGEKSMAQALASLRKSNAANSNPESSADPFTQWRKSRETARPTQTSLQDLLDKALKSRAQKGRPPVSGRGGSIVTPVAPDGDDKPPIRASGGLREFAATSQQ